MANRIGIISSYPPRQCGIASFTRSLVDAAESSGQAGPQRFSVVALATGVGPDAPPPPVCLELVQHDLAGYRRAAEWFNEAVDVVLLQHEFGLFGGPDGQHLLQLVGRLRRPLVTTLHTVLSSPRANQRRIIAELARASRSVIVMTQHSRLLLRETYGVPPEKIEVIPHGVPVVGPRSGACPPLFPARTVLLTTGLLSPGKGIQLVLQAMQRLVVRHPPLLYVVLGATHPEVKRRSGEAYREYLNAEAGRLGLDEHVRFIDEFVSEQALLAYLQRADIYVTPYPSREQSSSGTLAYAMACGNAIVSTAYSYAKEVLAGGCGLLVGQDDAPAMAGALGSLLSEPSLREELGRRALARSCSTAWPVVAERYLRLLAAPSP